MEIKRKKIKVLNRGLILTSRGMIPGPITTPYMETLDAILIMIARFDNQVVEVLEDGTEFPLTVTNFDKDNNKKEEVIPTVETRKEEPAKEITPTQPMNKHMSNKEKKRLEQEKRKAEEAAKAATKEQEPAKEAPVEEKKDAEPVSEVIPE